MSDVSSKIEVETFTLTTAPQKLGSYDVTRTAITIVNRSGANSIYIGPGSATSSDFEIAAGEALTINTRAEVWGVGTSSEDVRVLREFV